MFPVAFVKKEIIETRPMKLDTVIDYKHSYRIVHRLFLRLTVSNMSLVRNLEVISDKFEVYTIYNTFICSSHKQEKEYWDKKLGFMDSPRNSF